MEKEFINLTPENLDGEHLCCIIRSRKPHPGVEAKRRWLAGRLEEGHVFRKLDEKGAVFVEYAPLETAWVPVTGDNYLSGDPPERSQRRAIQPDRRAAKSAGKPKKRA